MAELILLRSMIASGVVGHDVLIDLRAACQKDSAPIINWLI